MMSENSENNEFVKDHFQESFGDFLKKHREASGKSLDVVSRVTRIPKRFLAAFEENAFKEFPEEAFTRGFLRSYAVDIGLDVDDVLARYDEFKRSQEPTPLREVKKLDQEFADLAGPMNLPRKGVVFAVTGVVVAFFLVILLWNLRSGDDASKESPTAAVETIKLEPADATDAAAKEAANKDVAPVISAADAKIATPMTPSVLTVKAVRKGRLSLRLDEHPAQDLDFEEGESRSFNIFKEAELKSPDKSAFQFQYNSKPLEVAGPVIKLFNRHRFLGKDSR
jgi:cytoskeletal protein RodZ